MPLGVLELPNCLSLGPLALTAEPSQVGRCLYLAVTTLRRGQVEGLLQGLTAGQEAEAGCYTPTYCTPLPPTELHGAAAAGLSGGDAGGG